MRALTFGSQATSSTCRSVCSRSFAFRPFDSSSRRHVTGNQNRVVAPAPHQRSSWQLPPVRASEQQASAFDFDEPETAKEGIDLGLVLCQQGRWSDALSVFEKSLNLPGTGIKRFRDKPRLISDGEKMALLYNIACCHSQLQDARSGLVALAGCMEAGYTDFAQVRSDPDLDMLRQDARFEGLMERFEKTPGNFLGFDLGAIFGQK